MVAGFAVEGNTLITWGAGIHWRRLPGGAELARADEACQFGRGGAVFEGGLVVNQVRPRPALVWYRGASPRVIEEGVESEDILTAELHGRRGVALIHKRAQVRFYELPSGAARDLYSIYTPAGQGGLLAGDVDGDGGTDLICGNYWLRSPASWELPWRLFAINTWTETPRSGMLHLAWLGGRLLAVQRQASPARAAWFTPPADPTRLWEEARIPIALGPSHSLVAVGGEGFYLTDGRLVRVQGGRARVLRGAGVRFACAVGADLLLISPEGAIAWWPGGAAGRTPEPICPAPRRP